MDESADSDSEQLSTNPLEETDELPVKLGKQYKDLTRQRAEILYKKQILTVSDEKEIEEFYGVLNDFQNEWPKLKFEKKQRLIGLVTKSIMIESLSPHWLRLTIEWLKAVVTRPDVCFIWRTKPNNAGDIEDYELDILRQYYPTFQTHREILQLLPSRTMYQIRDIVSKKLPDIHRIVKTPREHVWLPNVCWNDILAIHRMLNIDIPALSPEHEAIARHLAQTATEFCVLNKEKVCPLWLSDAGMSEFMRGDVFCDFEELA